MDCMFEVTKQPLSCSPVSLSRDMHELGKFVDSKAISGSVSWRY